jgi:uncharacterized protein YlxW (UPF0749 family)
MNITASLLAIFVAIVLYVFRGAKRQDTKPAPTTTRARKVEPTAEELASRVSDRKSYDKLCDRLTKAEDRLMQLSQQAAYDRQLERIETLQKAIEIVEAKYPWTGYSADYAKYFEGE